MGPNQEKKQKSAAGTNTLMLEIDKSMTFPARTISSVNLTRGHLLGIHSLCDYSTLEKTTRECAPKPPIVITLIQSVGSLVMTKWCSLLQLMVPLVVWLCEETERAVRARKYHISFSSNLH